MSNHFILTFLGREAITGERVRFLTLVVIAFSANPAQCDTLLSTMENFPDCVIEVYHRPGRDVLIVHAYDSDAWATTDQATSVFHAKIETNGQYA